MRSTLCATLVLSIVAIVLNIRPSAAQPAAPDSASPWTNAGTVGMTLSQVGLKNWAGGGQTTIAAAGIASVAPRYVRNESEWATRLEAGYGFTKIGDAEFRKSDDKIGMVSTYGYRFDTHLLATALLDVRTQFTAGYNYDQRDSTTGDYRVVSRFLSPGYFTLGLGVTWSPADDFTLLLAPLSNRAIVVLDDTLSAQGAYGVEPGKNVKSEFGSLLNATFKREIVTNVTLGSRLNVFARYDEFTSMVVNWETLFVMKVNDVLNASVGIDLVYDPAVIGSRDDGTVGPRLQFRDVLGIGASYTFR